MNKLLTYTPELFPELDPEAEDEVRGRRRSRAPVSFRGKPKPSVPRLRPMPLPRLIPMVPPLWRPPRDTGWPDDNRRTDQAGSQGSGEPANTQSAEPPSEYVRWVQNSLNRALGLQLPLDGIMNRETRSAVRSFQEHRGLPVNGLVGPETEAALKAGSSPAPAPDTAPKPEAEWEIPSSASCNCTSCKEGTMDYELGFEAEPFAGNRTFNEFEAEDSEALMEWQGETAPESPQRVRWIQESLNKILGLRLKVDGIMGPQTRSAIRSFQQNQGLVVDGIVGLKSMAAIVLAGAAAPPSSLGDGLVPASASLVRWIQMALNVALGLNLLIDGILGPQTRSALRRFQAQEGLNVTGNADPIAVRQLTSAAGAATTTGSTCAPVETVDRFQKSSDEPEKSALNDHTRIIGKVALCISHSQRSLTPIRALTVSGYASTEGDPQFNFQLGTLRAKRIARILADALRHMVNNPVYIDTSPGADGTAIVITTGSGGAGRPLGKGLERDRRVEIMLPITRRIPPRIKPPTVRIPPKIVKVPPIQSDPQKIQAALIASQASLSLAIGTLRTIESFTELRLIQHSDVQKLFVTPLAAIKDRLKATPSDSNFLSAIRRARGKMESNLVLQSKYQKLVRRDEADCKKNEIQQKKFGYAWSDIGKPQSGIRLCASWFGICQECRRDVVTHEFFHLVGLNDYTEAYKGERSHWTLDKSLDDANEMAQLVAYIAFGLTDACWKFEHGKPCNQAVS